MAGLQIAQTLDCRGLVCPMPVIKLSKAIKTIDKGAVLEMLATDPGSVPDVEAFQKQTGHHVVCPRCGGEIRHQVKPRWKDPAFLAEFESEIRLVAFDLLLYHLEDAHPEATEA